MVGRERLEPVNDLPESVLLWLERSINLDGKRFRQIDLDDLLDEMPVYAGRESLALFRGLVEVLPSDSHPLLVLPLPPTSSRTLNPPGLSRLLGMSWTHIEPPSLYLTTAELWWEWAGGEEYRVEVKDVEGLDDLTCYYRVFRSTEERSRNWEFNRGFYIRPR